MRKFSKILLIGVLSVCLSGCVKFNINMGIGEDKKVDFNMIYAIADMGSMLEVSEEDADISIEIAVGEEYALGFAVTGHNFMGTGSVDLDDENGIITGEEDGIVSGTLIDADDNEITIYIKVGTGESESDDGVDIEELKDNGFIVEDYEEDLDDDKKLVGYTISKKYDSIDKMTSKTVKTFDFVKMMSGDVEVDDSYVFTKKDNVYSSNIVFDLTIPETETATLTAEEMEEMAAELGMELVYSITLPMKPISSNATTVSADGKTLTWQLHYGDLNKIDFKFQFAEKNPNTEDRLFLGLFVVASSLLICGSLLHFYKKRVAR